MKSTVTIVQVLPYEWHIVSQKGHVLQKGINVGTVEEALKYVRCYASSFSDWTYAAEPLSKNK